MLKEIIANVPIARQFTMQELQQVLTQDFIILIHESTGIDVTNNTSSLTSPEIGAMVVEVKKVYDKIFESRVVNHDMILQCPNSFSSRFVITLRPRRLSPHSNFL